MPIQDETSVLPPLERDSNLDNAHATCPPEDDCPTTTLQNSTLSRIVDPANGFAHNGAANRPAANHGQAEEPQASAGATEIPAPLTVTPSTSQPLEDTSVVTQEPPSSSTAERLAKRYDGTSLKAAATSSAHAHPSPLPPPPRQALTPLNAPRVSQHTSSFLKHGSKFVGTQQSDRQVYNVTVELKHVDMRESFLCGYLRIEGLTDQQRILTTYFEGEIIGTKYTFQTRHPDWGSNMKVDMQHWNRFPAWRPLARQAQTENFSYRDYAQREHLFMRWKEHFLVPDHRVTHITGASFEGFYFICFNQIQGTISGIYFHSKSEKFQQLELKHVHDYGCKTAQEFA